MSDSVAIPTMAQLASEGKVPDLLFWVGCAGSFDARAQRISAAVAKVLHAAGLEFAILGNEETCTGDPARRAGNEFIFQMLALQNIETLNSYQVTKIVTACPHCFNTLKNEYPELGGKYEVIHHTQLINKLIAEGRLNLSDDAGERVTYHDSCYLGRVNGVYEVPREVLQAANVQLKEMGRSRQRGLCCGAGGAQMFKEDEPGDRRINNERVSEALATNTKQIIANCPFCITMLEDGVKARDKQDEVAVYDLSELIVNRLVSLPNQAKDEDS